MTSTATAATMQDSKFGEHLYLTPRVPQGLAAAVEGLTREVIRHRPDNIYAFAARHFENLLRLREEYGDTTKDDKKDTKSQNLNETVREKEENESKDINDEAKQSGWSLNETAKVLEKHRSIFGDSGQKVSTDQIRELANEPLITVRERKVDPCTAGTSRRKEPSPTRHDASKNGVRNAPKILSQIPIAKDIKTELRRNRISSRERKKVVACEYTRETIIEKSSTRKSFEKTKKSYEVRKSSRTEDSTTTTTNKKITSKSRSNSQEEKKFTRGASMDGVKSYIMQNFVGMTSLDELQSPSYVEKVQEVIDETSSVIKEKVEALKSGVIRAKAKQMKKEMSVSSDDHSKSSSKSEKNQEGNLSRRNSRSFDKDQDVSEESKSSLPAVRPLSSKSTSRSMSAKSDSDAALTLPPISPESAKSQKVKEELVLPVLSPPRTNGSLEDPDDTTAAVEEIAEDATVSLEEKIVEDVVEEKTVVVEKTVSLEDNVDGKVEEKVEEEEKKKVESVPSEEKLESPKESVDEKEVPPKDSGEEKVESVKDNDNDNEKVVPPGQSSGETEVPSKQASGETEVPSKEANGEPEVPSSQAEIPSKENSDEKEVIDDKPPVSEQVNDDKVSSQEFISHEKHEETTSSHEKLEKTTSHEKHEETTTSHEKLEETTIVHETVEETVIHEQVEETTTTIVHEKQLSNEIIAIEKASTDFLQVKQEEFPDSLNVTPEPFDTKGQRPDSLETSLAEDNNNKSDNSSGHVSPVETLKDKLLEIEEVQKRIEDVLDDTNKTSKNEEEENVVGKTDEATTSGSKIEDKLIEIQESEKRIEQILDSQSTTASEPTVTLNSDIKNKLQELEEAERRIENIFNNEAMKNDENLMDVELKESNVDTSGDEKSKIESEEKKEEIVIEKPSENLSVPTTCRSIPENPASRAVSPHSYILTEGSPYEIPDSVTRVIIPDRSPSPTPSEMLQVEVEDGEILSTLLKSKESEPEAIISQDDAFGEVVTETSEAPTTIDKEYALGIKASHDAIVSRENLDRIDEAVIDSEDEKVLKVVTSSLEEILEKSEVEYVEVQQIVKYIEEEKQETIENSLESTVRSIEESTNEFKETSVTTDRSSSLPLVPELNLDSLPDLSISSFNLTTDKETTTTTSSSKKDDSLERSETQEFEKLEERLLQTNEATAASDIIVPEEDSKVVVDINNVVCSDTKEDVEENKDTTDESQCTIDMIQETTTEPIEINRLELSMDNSGGHVDEKKEYHIYVPEANSSKDVSSSSETSTFMSAATKIQAGVRGFLTRRRLQSTQKRSSTLDSVPSIQESFIAVDTTSIPLMPIVESSIISEAKARKKLRREDAVQRTTLSVENAFAENQLQHTGEFHDCIPLPVFDAKALSMKTIKERELEKAKEKTSQVEHLLEKILLGHAAQNFGAHPKLVDVVLLQADTELQSKYLNFITSVEDVYQDVPETPKGVIIEEITSLDEASKKEDTTTTTVDKAIDDGEETLASISTEDPMSINIEEVLGLGEEDETSSRKSNRLNVKLNALDQVRSSSVSQDSPVSDERTKSPVTMMQIAPKSVDEKSTEEPNPT